MRVSSTCLFQHRLSSRGGLPPTPACLVVPNFELAVSKEMRTTGPSPHLRDERPKATSETRPCASQGSARTKMGESDSPT